MKNKFLPFVTFLLLGSFVVSGKTNNIFAIKNLLLPVQIDTSDKVVFDMENAILTATYVDIPVSFLANDFVLSVDFSVKYNESKLTFDSVINYKSYLSEFAHYNPADQFLRLTSSASNINNFYPIENNTTLFAIRFRFNVPSVCNEINPNDFRAILVYLNGDRCSYEIKHPGQLDFSSGDNGATCVGPNTFKTNTNKIVNDTIASWFWDFGNGETSSEPKPVVTFLSPATYTVTLIVQSNSGCSDTVKKAIAIHSSPMTSFTYAPDCTTGNITFIDLSSINFGIISAWNWDFGDNRTSLLMNPIHNYDLGGKYSVSLTAISDSGCTSISTQVVPVDMLSANFIPVMGCVGEPINFKDSSTSTPTSGLISDYLWYFDDINNTTSVIQNPTITYPFAGTYHVRLKTSNFNCADSISKTVIIEDKPVVKFSEDKLFGCMPLTVHFSDSSIIGSASTYVWKFNGIPDTAISKKTAHIFNDNGAYSVKLIATTSAGCTDSLEKTSYITVSGVTASFTASPEKIKLPDATIRFTNRSNSYSNWTWNFGDSIYSSDKVPEHTFTEAGMYTVCLTGINSDGCRSIYCDSVTVENANIIAIPQAFTPNGDNSNDVLRVRGGPIKEMEMRIFNEWGNQVFVSNTQNEGWDGSYNGTPQAVGVYEYVVKGKTADNESIDMHGVVNLIR